MATQVLISDSILRVGPDGPRLVGSRCTNCGTHAFPETTGCSKCAGADMETVELASRGTLWTWTVQGFPPKAPPYIGETSPDKFQAFGVGYVELPGQVKVETRLTESDPAKLKIGMEMELCLVPLTTDENGNEVVTFAFRPIA